MSTAGSGAWRGRDRQQGRAAPNSFDSLRLIGSLMVLGGHACIITGHPAPVLGTIALHSLGVCIFFSISGYLITQSWLSDPAWRRYLQRRVLRIAPALIVVVAVTALLIGAWATTEPLTRYYRHGWTWRYIVSNIALVTVWGLPGVFDTLPIHGQANGSLWTLPIEFGLYLTAPAMVALRRIGGPTAPATAAVLATAALVMVPSWPTIFSYNLLGIDIGKGLALAPFFWVGAALRLIGFGDWSGARRQGALTVATAVTLAWAWTQQPALLPIGVVAIAVMVLAIGLTPWLHSTVIARTGDLSYGTYLWAFPLQQLAMLKLGGGALLNLLLAAPPTLLLAVMSWRLIERPALMFKPHRRARPEEEIGPAISAEALQSPAEVLSRHET